VAGMWGRMVAAVGAAVAAWNESNLVPIEQLGWDTYAARLARYYLNRCYYHNTVYTSLEHAAGTHKHQRGLYKHIRPVYNPVERLVELYVAKTYGGALDMEELTRGAIPIADATPRLRNALRQLWIWSNWSTAKSVYVRHGAMLGDMAIKVVDDRAMQQVRLEPIDPAKIRDIKRDSVGNIIEAVIQYEYTEEQLLGPITSNATRQTTYVYTEVINQDRFQTFRDGKPHAFYADANGTPVSQWPNEYGFVPLEVGKFRDMGLTWGAAPFNAQTRKIDELNDSASNLHDQIRKVVNPIWYMPGVKKEDKIQANNAEKDQMTILYGPEGSQPWPMIAPIDISAAIENIDHLLAELERDLPELAMHRLRDSGDLTAPGVKMAYDDALGRLVEGRGSFDATLVRSQKMAIRIGGYNRYPGFEGFSLNDDPEHMIADRPIIDDSLSSDQRIQHLIATGAPDQAIWAELGVSEDQIRAWTRLKEQRQLEVEARMERQIEIEAQREPAQLGAGAEGRPNAA
jgi:hypothetical protein